MAVACANPSNSIAFFFGFDPSEAYLEVNPNHLPSGKNMSFTRRTRMISFRVSENEFQELRTRSEEQGARSVSDYARLALRESTGTPDMRIEADLDQLSVEVQRLSTDIRRLTDLLEGPRYMHLRNGHAATQNGDSVDA